MGIQQDLGSAFILNVHHLLGWKESPGSWGKLCQTTDETVNVKVCACACVCECPYANADSVSVLILKAALLSESRSVKWGYTPVFINIQRNTKRQTYGTEYIVDLVE